MKKIITLLLIILLLCGCLPRGSKYEDFEDHYVNVLPENAEDGLTLHAFNWTYQQISDNLESIANAGFKNVLTMPVQQPKNSTNWWAFYQPLSFYIGDNSPLGSKEELEALCKKAEEYGICILADVVVNHMATTDDEGKEADGTPTVSPLVEAYEPILYNNRNEEVISGYGITFHHNKNASGSGSETQYYQYGNLPDLNTSNEYVQERVLNILKECIDVGIDGFRFDAAKHVETSSDPDYASDFWESTVGVAKDYYHEKTGKNLYVYGEILSLPYGRALSLYTSFMRVTDDGFFAQYRNCMAQKDASIILNASLKVDDPTKLIAWVESHDEYITSNNHYSEERIAKYWSIIAAKKGLGGLYLARPKDNLAVGEIGSYAFEDERVATINRFHNRFYDAESYESAEGTIYVNEKILPNDQGALIINVDVVNPDEVVKVKVPHLENGNYYDSLTGSQVVVDEGIASVKFEENGVAIITRSKDVHPQLMISQREGSFIDDLEIELAVRNVDEAYYYFNNNQNEKIEIKDPTTVSLKDHVKDGNVILNVFMKKGNNEIEKAFTYHQVKVQGDKFNVINLDEKYFNDYELYLWSWSPGKWNKDYEIKDGVLLVDVEKLDGFLIGIFEKGYEVTNLNTWDKNVLKQSFDISGDILKQGFVDMSGF